MKELEQFLLNNDIDKFIYLDNEYTSRCYYYYKERYNDRFVLIYERAYEDGRMEKSSYEFAGYYDFKDKVLYNASYDLDRVLSENKSMSFSSIGELEKKIDNAVTKSLIEYAIKHQDELKEKHREEFLNQDKYTFERLEKEVQEQFIESENLDQLTICDYYTWEGYTTTKDYKDTSIYTKYLDNPEVETKKIVKEVILKDTEKIEKDMAFNLLKNEYKNHYLSLINENAEHIFDDIHINRDLLASIKDIDAQNLNITIQYDNDKLTFKYPKSSLKCELRRCNTCASGYKKAYDPVKEFLNQHKDETDYRKNDFDFRNIISISYGKQILFEKNIDLEKEKSIDDDFEDIEK